MLFIALAALALGAFGSGGTTAIPQGFPTPAPDRPNIVTLFQVADKLDAGENIVLLDARTQEEYEAGHASGAISLPLAAFAERFSSVRAEFPADAELISYCNGNGCELSTKLAEALKEQGYVKVKVFIGGWSDWLAAGLPTRSGKAK